MSESDATSRTPSTPSADGWRRAWYVFMQFWFVLVGAIVFRLRVVGRRNVPLAGGVLLASNHQSFLDPVLVGVGLPRSCTYLARSTLFRAFGFRWLIRSLNAVPIDREGMDVRALRSCIRAVRAGGALVLFPEMTRTPDGDVHEMHKGFALISARADAPVVPVAIEGAFASWPRHRLLPRAARVCVAYGEPIRPGDVPGGHSAFVREVQRRVEVLRLELAEGMSR